MDLPSHIARQQHILAPYAVPATGTLGRSEAEYMDPEDSRLPFERDRGRVMHSTPFRLLDRKTQVFPAGTRDHFRTRLTHTLEVANIARGLARSLSLNEDLAETIALAHDLGHPPFGHVGEGSLNTWMQTYGLQFEHNLQSHRIVSVLVMRTDESAAGLNLNHEVLEGLMKHQQLPHARTLEAQIVDLSDRIAYLAHDTDDGIRSGLITVDQVCATALGKQSLALQGERKTKLRHAIIHTLARDVKRTSHARITAADPQSVADVYDHQPEELVGYSRGMEQKMREYYDFLFQDLYCHPQVTALTHMAEECILSLCNSYIANPPEHVLRIQRRTESTLVEAVKDYVAGMTDDYAKAQYELLKH